MRRLFLSLITLVALWASIASGTSSVSAALATGGSGYWMLGADGDVYPFGDAADLGSPTLAAGVAAVDLEPTRSGDGYWVTDSAGRVEAFGKAVHHGDADRSRLATGDVVTSLSATPSGKGYWLFTTAGRAFALGDAAHYGDMATVRLNAPVLDSVPTPSGEGYYMVAADGGIFSFGDAKFYGSMGDTKLNAPVQSLVPDGDGAGYWLVAADGGIFSFEAPFNGSLGATPLNKPVTGMVRYGDGYLMVGEDGGIFNFSRLPFSGSLGDRPPAQAIVSVGAFETPTGHTTSPIPAPSPANPQSPESTTTTTTIPTTTTTSPPASEDEIVLAGLPAGEPTDVLPCQDGSGETALVWDHPGDEAETWGAHNPCDDKWIIIDRPGDSESDPYGEALSVAPGAQFHHRIHGMRGRLDNAGSGRIALASQPLDGTGECPVGYTLFELRPEHDGHFQVIGSCPNADDLGWNDEAA